MAKNYKGPISPITCAAPANVTSGQVLLVGDLLCVAQATALSTEDVAFESVGVFECPAATSQAWTILAKLYWDDTAKVFTTTASGNTLRGHAAAVKGSSAALGLVRLTGHVV